MHSGRNLPSVHWQSLILEVFNVVTERPAYTKRFAFRIH